MPGFPMRALAVGYPGSGKTGALAALANAGLRLRILAFDKSANMQSLFAYTRPEFHANIDVIACEDPMRADARGDGIEFAGKPDGFLLGLRSLDHWKSQSTGQDLGRSKEWGLDTVVVLDSLTANGLAAHRRALHLGNRTMRNGRDSDYNLAMNEQEAFVDMLTASSHQHHVYVTAHLKLIGPQDVRKGEDDLTEQIKRQQADLIPTRLYPTALGRQLPTKIGGYFSTLLLFETEAKNGKTRRVIRTNPREELDVKVPGLDLPPTLDASTGLLTIFNAVTPGVEACLAASVRTTNEGK